MITPAQAIDAMYGRFGRHPGYRTLHAKGIFGTGTFTAAPEAAGLTRAAHMQGAPVPATVRFSNASGDPGTPDYAPDVRGFAVSFELPDGSATDLVSQTVPRFPARTPEAFVEMTLATTDDISRAWKLPRFLARHREALPTLRPNLAALKPTPSFATVPYYALNAFKWVDANGGQRFVRYTWLPDAGEQHISGRQAKKLGANYLQEELAQRLEVSVVRMTLQVQIAAPGDRPDDPVAAWPKDRETVDVGTLEVTALDPDRESRGAVIFDPTRMTDGIELSDDPILKFRAPAYSVSFERRTAAD